MASYSPMRNVPPKSRGVHALEVVVHSAIIGIVGRRLEAAPKCPRTRLPR